MDTTEISQKARQVISYKIGRPVDAIQPKHRIGGWTDPNVGPDLGEDSLDRVEIVMGIEDEFDIDISDEDATQWKTVGDMIAYVAGKAGA